ncbi:hypothetical protein SY88_23815 [Clostridiales bacterium PH28_bin88]|nr:hypothetical protein SY88_23815 [Clostridiales bacterium PH28_bin88]
MTDSIVDLIKSKLRIEDVIEQDGFPLPKRGRWRKCTTPHTGGLVVDVQGQVYHWYSRNEWGDVIQWVQNQHKLDFKAACELLCRLAGLPDPNWSGQDPAVRLAARQREDALEVAQRVFMRWLLKSDQAVAYCAGRGWKVWQDLSDPETPGGADRQPGAVMLAKLGYSGEGTDEERQELRGELIAGGVDLDSPVAVAILGYRGDVQSWAAKHNLEGINPDWVERGYIPGIFGKNRLVYPHLVNGRIRYLSSRGIIEKFHYNLPDILVGKRQVFNNHVYATATETVVIVEGQADAISWGLWGYAAVALAGVSLDEEMAKLLRERHKNIYLALDMDYTGINNAWRLAELLGPTVRLLPISDPGALLLPLNSDLQAKQREAIEQAGDYLRAISAVMRWPIGEKFATYPVDGDERQVKDSNDLLRSMAAAGHDDDKQASVAKLLLDRAPMFVEAVTSWAGAREGAARDEAIKRAVGIINRLDEFSLAQNKGRLAKILQVTMRELERMLKAAAAQATKERSGGEATYTWGEYVDGWLLEYLYDRENGRALLAWRDPDGKVDSGFGVAINGRFYEPYPPNDLMKMGSIHFPSALGDKKSIAELVTYLRMYLKSVYIMPSDKLTKLVAYWILETWLYDCFSSTIYLRAMGSAGAGKSEFVLRVGLACYRMMQASGTDTTASLFRAVHRYRGTVLIDEADISYSDTDNEMVKFYNQGAFKGRPIMRTREVTLEDGSKDWETVAYNIYSPKLIGMRKDFKDDAVGTRSLTLKLVTREMPELVAAGIPLNVDEAILAKAQAIRNLLLRFRLEHWQPEIPIDAAWFDLSISPRLNQVAGPLLAIARDDPEQQEDIRQVLRDYYQETILNQSMTMTARIIEALWKIWKYPDLRKEMVRVDEEGNSLIKIGDVTRIANEIMDEMNDPDAEDTDEDVKRSRRTEIKAQRVGRILREELMMQVSDRRRDGFWVYWNEPRMLGLSTKFGVNPDNFGPQPEKAKPVQERLA